MKNNSYTLTGMLGKLALATVLTFSLQTAKAQLTGTKNVPGDYATLNLAITDLNAQGVGAGGVIINLIAGNPETAPAGGYKITTLTGTAANPITIVGNSNVITANAGLTAGSLTDAIFKIVGADYVTIGGFVMQENAANTDITLGTNNMTEFGVALFYASATDGAQNNTIAGNTITLNKTYANTWGVYSNVRHDSSSVTVTADITAPTGANSNNKVYGNIINNVNYGIAFIGSGTAANMDSGNDIGGTSSSTGNTITNWGGLAASGSMVSNSGTSYCIFMNHQTGENVQYNTLTSAAVSGVAVTFRGIFKDYTASAPTGTFTSTISNNTITMSSAFTSGTFQHILSQGMGTLATATININSNTILNSALTGVSTSSAFVGILNSSAPGTLAIDNNILQGGTSTATTGGFTGISNTGAVVNSISISNNQIGTGTANAVTFSAATSGTFSVIACTGAAGTATVTINGNNIRSITQSVIGSNVHTYINNTGAALNVNITNNVFNNITAATTNTTDLISHNYTIPAGGSCTISGNSINTAFNRTGASGTFRLTHTNAVSGTTAAITYSGNTFSNISMTGSTTFTGINNTDGGGGSVKTITGNTLSNITHSGTGTINCMNFTYLSGNTSSISGNTISNVTGTSTITGLTLGNTVATTTGFLISSNTITALSSTGTGGNVTGITSSNTGSGIAFTNNSINTLSSTGASSTVSAITISGGASNTISGNTIHTIASSGTTSPLVRGIIISGSTLTNIVKNKIYGISASGAITTTNGAVNGIAISGGTTVNAYNNIIGELTAPAAALTDAIRGINITSTATSSTYNIYNNSIYLNASSTGVNFGTSGLFHTTNATATTASLNLQNNLIINNSTPAGTGITAAYRRSSTTLTNFASTSNKNLYYAGTAGASNLLFYDGTNSAQTIPAYQAIVGATIDALAVTENTTFLSTTGSSANFLHVNAAIANLIESAANPIVAVTDDFDGDIRQGQVGYTGTGTAPDIGADEFEGTSSASCTGTPTSGSISGASLICQNTGTTLTLSGASAGVGYTYQWQSATVSGGPWTNMGTSASTQATGNIADTMYYQVIVTCAGSGLTATTTEFTVNINPAPAVAVTPTTGLICKPSGTAVALTASGATTYAWSPTTGLTPSTGANVSANPNTTTTYTVTGTDGNGCTATATSTITVSESPSINPVATPTAVCTGTNSQLDAAAGYQGYGGYSVSSITYAPIATPTVGVTTLCNTSVATTATSAGDLDDGVWQSQTIPFNFTYLGTTYTSFAVSTNGFIVLGAGAPNTYTGYGNAFPSTASGRPSIAGAYFDLDFRTVGTIEHFSTGTAPNRKLVINWTGGRFWNEVNPSNVTVQIVLNESSNIIEVHTTNVSHGTSTANGVQGIQNAAGNAAVTVTGRNGTAWNAGTSDAYQFAPIGGTITYSWSPATFLSSTTISNPVATAVTATTTWTLTATNSASGCTSVLDSATVMVDPLSPITLGATPSTTVCEGTAVTITPTVTGGGAPYTYTWSSGQTTANITVSPNDTTTYTLTVLDACGTSVNNAITINVNPLPVVVATPTTALYCNPGSAVNMTVSGASTYVWAPATGLSSAFGNAVDATPSTTTSYTVTGTDVNGCVSTDTATVTVSDGVVLGTTTATPDTICAGTNSVLNTSASLNASAFCQPTYTNGTGFGDYISLVQLNTLNNTSGASGAPYYTLYPASGTTTTTLTAGTSYTITLSAGTYTQNDLAAWIDYDQNGTFSAGEKLGEFNNLGATPATTTIVFTVPLTAYNGSVRFRVREMDYGSTGIMDPCTAQSTFGEVEDYVITITGGAEPVTYAWTPSTFLSSTNAASVTAVAMTASTNYTVTATAGNGCTATATASVTVNPTPVAPTAANAVICSGFAATLSATATETVGWYDAATGGNYVAGGTPYTTPAMTTSDTLYVQDSTSLGCESSRTQVIITVNPNPVVALGTDSTRCGGTVTLDAGNAGSSYAWSTTEATQTIVVNSTNSYNVTVTDGNGCIGQDTILVTINTIPTVALGADQNICGDSTVLDALNAGNTYLWNTTETTQSITVMASGAYDVQVTSPQGCTGADTINVVINPAPVVNLGSDTVMCGGVIILDAQNAGSTYAWNDASTFSILVASATGTYWVDVTNPQGCTVRDSVDVTVNAVPAVNLGFDVALCSGDSVTLDAGVTAGASYTWNDASTNQTLVANSTGTYYVTVTTGPNCTASDTVDVTVNSNPVVSLTLATDSICSNGAAVALTGESPAGGTYSGTGVSGGSYDPTASTGATEVITYSYTDGNGCSAMTTDTITLIAPPTVGLNLTIDSVCVNDGLIPLSGETPVGGVYSGTSVSGTDFDPSVGAGNYTITYTYTDSVSGCAGTATENMYVDICFDASSEAFANLSVYPNPNKGTFFIEMGQAEGKVIAEIFTVQGKLLSKEQLNANSRNMIDVQSLSNGIYMLRITYDGQVKNIKINVSK